MGPADSSGLDHAYQVHLLQRASLRDSEAAAKPAKKPRERSTPDSMPKVEGVPEVAHSTDALKSAGRS